MHSHSIATKITAGAEATRGVHSIDRWKQDASWKKVEKKVKLGIFLRLTSQQNAVICIAHKILNTTCL